MNIGETDADGWTEVDWYEAATALKNGTHEVERSLSGADWHPSETFHPHDKYRTREKARTITVTHARPIYIRTFKDDDGKSAVVQLFNTHDEAVSTYNAIRNAMEQS